MEQCAEHTRHKHASAAIPALLCIAVSAQPTQPGLPNAALSEAGSLRRL
jgi:hypothetical protein